MRGSAYWSEFYRTAVEPGLVRQLQQCDGILEVLDPVGIKIPILGEVKTVKGQRQEFSAIAEYLPGQVLRRKWRRATKWERNEWTQLFPVEIDTPGVFRQGNNYSIQIVERITGLPEILRQLIRHVPGSEIGRVRPQFTLPGNAMVLEKYCERLFELTKRLFGPVSEEMLKEFSREADEIARVLEHGKTVLKQRATNEIKRAQQGRSWERASHTTQGATYLLEQIGRSYRIVLQDLELAAQLVQLVVRIDKRFYESYVQLGKLGQELQTILQQNPQNTQRMREIAEQGFAVYQRLNQVPRFNPYYDRLQNYHLQRLSSIVEHARQGSFITVYNDLAESASRLEALAIRARPTQTEVQQWRGMLL